MILLILNFNTNSNHMHRSIRHSYSMNLYDRTDSHGINKLEFKTRILSITINVMQAYVRILAIV